MNSEARDAVARVFEEILSRRNPGLAFSVPDEGTEPESPTRTRKVVRALAAPEDARPLGDIDTPLADEDRVKTGAE